MYLQKMKPLISWITALLSFEENNKWVIEVIDNGNGFVYNKEFNSAGYGLENMKKRSQEAGFELGIFSNDTGTTIRIIVV